MKKWFCKQCQKWVTTDIETEPVTLKIRREGNESDDVTEMTLTNVPSEHCPTCDIPAYYGDPKIKGVAGIIGDIVTTPGASIDYVEFMDNVFEFLASKDIDTNY